MTLYSKVWPKQSEYIQKHILTFDILVKLQALHNDFVHATDETNMAVQAANKVFSRDATGAMFVPQTNPPGIEPYSYANVFFCFGRKTCSLITWLKTLCSYRFSTHISRSFQSITDESNNGYANHLS